MSSKLSRHLVLATLAAALLMAPLPASAAQVGGATFESALAWVGGLLRHLWAEEGGSFDPLGLMGAAPTAEGGRHLWAEEGVSIDPLGRTAPPPAAQSPDGQ